MRTRLLFVSIIFTGTLAACVHAAALCLAEADNGRTNAVKVADLIEITLAGNPTTGYSWDLVSFSTNKLQQMGEVEYRQAEQAGGKLRVGVGGQFIFRFKAIEPGSGDVKLIYRRSWETTVYDKVYSVILDVKYQRISH